MKAKKTIRVIITAVVIIGAMAAAFALGASGKFSMVNPHDRLLGVLITTQPWPDGEDRVYAEYVDGEYVFNGIDGIACFASMDDNTLCTHVDDAMTDASVDLHSVNDDAGRGYDKRDTVSELKLGVHSTTKSGLSDSVRSRVCCRGRRRGIPRRGPERKLFAQ